MTPGRDHERRTRNPLTCTYPRCQPAVPRCQTMAASVTRMMGHFVPSSNAEPIDDNLDA
jgi:hypothetical protein